MRLLAQAWVLLACVTGFSAGAPLHRGLLVYPDGNRLTGRLVAEGVFQSDMFGEVRFKAAHAHFEPDQAIPTGDTSREPKERVAAETKQAVTPSTAKPEQHWLHPWKLSFGGFYDSTLEDGVRRHEYNLVLHIDRPREGADQISLDLNYDFIRKYGRIDKRRATAQGDWRHDLSPRWFTLYRPYGEYDGFYLDPDFTALLGRDRLDYLLTQQQAGLGFRLVDGPRFKSLVAASWSWFYIRVYHLGSLDAGAPSLMIEHDLKLPLGFEFRQTGQVYYRKSVDKPGWENRMDLTKRFGSRFFLTLRHEYRKDYPAPDANPIDRVRVLFGLGN